MKIECSLKKSSNSEPPVRSSELLGGMAISTWRLLEFLQRELTDEQKRQRDEWISALERERADLEERCGLTQQNLDRLNIQRANLSGSLKRSEDSIQSWNQAQKLILEWILSDRVITLGDIVSLNAVLRGTRHSGWRAIDIFTTQIKHINSSDVDSAMNVFLSYLQKTMRSEHPLYSAFVCRYWVLSIHPFEDGNGRTSQLLSDYFLLKNGFLPQVFLSLSEKNLIGDPEKKSFMDPYEGFKRFCQTIRNAYQVCRC